MMPCALAGCGHAAISPSTTAAIAAADRANLFGLLIPPPRFLAAAPSERPSEPVPRVAREDFLAPLFRDGGIECPIDRIERRVRPIGRIKQHILAAAQVHQHFEMLRIAREA